MTDAEIVARAAAAGWVWLPAGSPRWGPQPGWEQSTTSTGSSFISCSRDPDSPRSQLAVARGAFDHAVDCRECGLPADAQYSTAFKAGRCFLCNFWADMLSGVNEETRVVVGGTHFIAGAWTAEPPAYGTEKYNGFGGRKFVVGFTAGPNAGRTLTTYDLWHQGPIPAHFRDRLPDNAVFVENTSAVRPPERSATADELSRV